MAIKNKVKKEKTPIEFTYIYHVPKDEEEAREQEKKVDKAYEMLFELVLEERRKKKDYKQ